MIESMDGARWRAARRAVLDHLLRLLADSPLGETLVLRGSMVMPAWVGAAAREPADLDWIVPRPDLVPVDPLHPHPHVAALDDVRQWPEAADGADRYEIFRHEDLDTRGLRAVPPPEGLHWLLEPDDLETVPVREELLALVRRRPVAAPGVVLHPDGARDDPAWAYSEYSLYYSESSGCGAPGLRVVIPWSAEGLPAGEARLDFARDERLPQAPVLTAIPAADGSGPTPVRTASRELSLAWKLLWLHIDSASATEGRAQGKDLYDAVLLAESPGTRLPRRLLRTVFRREPAHPADRTAGNRPTADAGLSRLELIRPSDVDWTAFRTEHPWVPGTAEDWLNRLRRALASAVQD
ncbi:nucleotidyl transferase AbiEii/AbiGii toxin family protein [Streptomyces sp. B93]|uniref:nucleotidyl transferase AbiEii/AbiGii toxin family protein n=1 Tax=Streptomyces sp. B93 TaxID=2824875 RepID=UPI0027E3F585|nr:nucleotidyl transferase AbiEii/AbiGii toxin family protein [Streptomyces sp. B93]